jgi:hypothetical protein
MCRGNDKKLPELRGSLLNFDMESLILAQNERWRRA